MFMRLFQNILKRCFLDQSQTCKAQFIHEYFLQLFSFLIISLASKQLTRFQRELLLTEGTLFKLNKEFIQILIDSLACGTNLPILRNFNFVRPEFLEHVHFITTGFFSHFTYHQSPNFIVHDNRVVGVGLHVNDQIWFEILDQGENYLPHYLEDLESKWRFCCAFAQFL